jgi:YidC/Oxa1 family membrane protein insertase
MDNENLRNTLLFLACALTILAAYQAFVLAPIKRRQVEMQQAPPQRLLAGGPAPASTPVPLARLLAASPRVTIDTPSLAGSISLRGARLDNLFLKRYRATTDPRSPTVELLRPEGNPNAWFAEVGWAGANVSGLPDSGTLWAAPAGAVLTPNTPVELSYANGRGLLFHRTISVDRDYMFTITDRVSNDSGAPVDLQSYAVVRQQALSADVGRGTNHEGAIGVFDGRLVTSAYKAWKKTPLPLQTSTGGWMGITEKYWLAAVVPGQAASITGAFRAQTIDGADAYQAGFAGPVLRIAPGQSIVAATHVFAGAKSVALLRRYGQTLAIPRFDDAVDWGWLWFFTKPIFFVLQGLQRFAGNVGVAILLLTLCIRLPLFPLASRSFAAATKMKTVQPLVDDLRRKFETEPDRLRQEIATLHAREKVKPLAGCILALIPLPIFFALYKVLSVTIELRHAPFFGWIADLSARDPSTLWNLFGLAPWNPAHAPLIGAFLDGAAHIGVWPLIYGATSWLTQLMNTPSGIDPVQQRILRFMPLVITFAFAQLAAGLVIYYVWSNLLTVAQQYANMRLFKVANPIDGFINRFQPNKGPG